MAAAGFTRGNHQERPIFQRQCQNSEGTYSCLGPEVGFLAPSEGGDGAHASSVKYGRFLPYMHPRPIFSPRSFARCTAVWILFLSCWPRAQALDPKSSLHDFGRRVWQTDEGLPQNTVSCIVQSADGYLWIATGGGVARFDGVRFQVFDRRNTPELHSNAIGSLYQDSRGVLWIGTPDGLTSYDGTRWSILTVTNGLPSNDILSVHEDRRGVLWILTANGVAKEENGKISSITAKAGPANGSILSVRDDASGSIWMATEEGLDRLANGHISSVYKGPVAGLAESPEGDIWIATQEGLALIANGKVKFISGSPALPESNIDNLLADRDGHLWLGGPTGLTVWDKKTIASYTTHNGLPGNHIYKLFEDREGAIWVSTDGGLARIVHGKVDVFARKEGRSAPLVLTMFEDREGSLWLGTDAGGLTMLRNQKFTSYTSAEGLIDVDTKTILEDRHHVLWVGTDGGGLNTLLRKQFTSIGTRNGLSSDVVSSLAVDAEGGLWVGTPDGLNHLQQGNVSRISSADGLPDDYIRSLLTDVDGSLWIGTRHGLCHWQKGRISNYTEEDGLSSDFIGAMTKDSAGKLWIGTSNGLDLWSHGKFFHYGEHERPSNNPVTALYAESAGALWIGTKGGALKRLKNGVIFSYESMSTIPENIYGLVADSSGNLWIASDKGVYCVSIKALNAFADGQSRIIQTQKYGTADGMPSSECSSGGHPSVGRSHDGTLWFTTPRGIASIQPERAEYNKVKPPVAIEQVSVDDSPVPLSSPLVVSPGHTRYEFRYAGLSFIAPQAVQYRYRLYGFDKSWIEAGTRRRAYYTNLKPGNYRFRVIAANNDGVWNKTGASFYFQVKPHIYQTIWFYFALCMMLGLLGYELYQLRMKRVALEFNATLAERNRIAREIHDTLAQGFVGISLQLEVAKRLFGDKNHALKMYLDEALALANYSLSEARRSIWDLRSQGSGDRDFPAHLATIVQQARTQSSAEISLKVTGAYRSTQENVAKELLKITQEGILNAVRHANARHIRVLLAYEETRLRITVTDDGRGFIPSRDAPSEPAGHFGLTGMQERAKLIGAALHIDSQQNAGTSIIVEISA